MWVASKDKCQEERREEEIASEPEGPFAFEDNPMPILKGSLEILKTKRRVKVLIDSGSGINLISEKVARELLKGGIKTSKAEGMKIKIAMGRGLQSMRCSIPLSN